MSTVLIVEDNRFFRRSFSEILRLYLPSLLIEETGDGHEAMRKISAAQPDIIFMDIGLPGVNGLELTREIKEAHPEITVNIFTSYDLPEYRERAYQYGADNFLLKDALSGAEIATLVKLILSRKRKKRSKGKRTVH